MADPEDPRKMKLCKYLDTPEGCWRGPCPFSHDADLVAGSKKKMLCHSITKPGGCRKGDTCDYSHDLKDAAQPNGNNSRYTPPSHARQSNWRQDNDKSEIGGASNSPARAPTAASTSNNLPSPDQAAFDKKFRQWRYNTVEKSLGRPLGGAIAGFFKNALEFVNGDVAAMQETITCLGSNGGLERIKELLGTNLDGNEEHVTRLFLSRILPFFQAITHPTVAASGLLENPVYNIYNAIFGPGGQRAVKLFSSLANMFDLLQIEALEAISAVLSRTADLNGAAAITEGLLPIAEVLATALGIYDGDLDERALRARKHLERLQRRLGVGSSIPVAQRPASINNKSKSKVKAKFDFIRDPPGRLSDKGRRHDNDSDNIQEISILPTSEGIMSSRAEYLPPMDPAELHLPGIEGLLDRQFRLLREDTISQLRDAIRIELHQLQNPTEIAEKRKWGQQGIRTYSYPILALTDLKCDMRNGLNFLIHFDQPKHLQTRSQKDRREWWDRSRRLQTDALVCIIDTNGSATFCTVPDQQKKKPSEILARDPQRASVNMRMVETDDASAKIILWQFFDAVTGASGPQKLLVEFPGIFLPAFQPTLEALQTMSKSSDLPFAELLAPVQGSSIEVSPPVYAQQPRFSFDLSCIMRDEQTLNLCPGTPFDINALRNGSTLDDAQANALVAALSRRLALIQGPPGTGKSYTGVSITKVLISNRKKAKLGPIICVCYTNHALDQILEHLHENGVKQIIRMGSRSISQVLAALNLRSVVQTMERTKEEKKRNWEIGGSLTKDIHDINRIVQEIPIVGSHEGLEEYLELHQPDHYNELFGLDIEGFRTVHHDRSQIVANWLSDNGALGAFASPNQDRRIVTDIEMLREKSLFDVSPLERHAIHDFWLSDMHRGLEIEFLSALEMYREDKKEHDRIRNELDLRCLQQANVIGVTTSGLARNIDLLRRLQAKVLLCEEAGEVLEAHILTALLPSVEHAIFIGDHLQLRPQIQNYDLQHDNPHGKQYSLDVSLFERLVDPKLASSPRLPFSTLQTQRRMHPSIAQLVREPLYPLLKDADVVTMYPDVPGMKRRLFWLDHSHPEAGSDASDIISTSHSNDFEVEMTVSLVSHLIRQGVYQAHDIAVLTPYLGQLMKIRRHMASRFEVTLGERDVDELEKAGIVIEKDERPTVVKSTLLSTLKVATVDNFQGEEAKIVVISLVRCNPQNKCGFLKTSNRINVLLSRAKHGMYIIGNSRTSSHVPMWSEVLSILKANDNIGSNLELCCPRHQDTLIHVATPDEFAQFSPEGGCQLKCTKKLSCGHACIQRCHSSVLHDAVTCLEACTRSKPGCQHLCPLPCGEKCHAKCQAVLDGLDIVLGCGHRVTSLPCWQFQNTSTIHYDIEVNRMAEACGHYVKVKCHQDVNVLQCYAPCGELQSCGHACNVPCSYCETNHYQGVDRECTQLCDRPYATCNHRCRKPCHGTEPCARCDHPCEVRCSHSRCTNICSEPCAPCAEDTCNSCCPHSNCSLPCAAPCDWLPCSKRCEKVLKCGHQCPTLCGETCPDETYWQSCAKESIKNQIVDFILTYEEINLNEDP